MRDVIQDLTEEQLDFISCECGLDKNEIVNLSEDELYDKVYEKLCDIEIETIPEDDEEEESERCKMASDLVTKFGNSLVA